LIVIFLNNQIFNQIVCFTQSLDMTFEVAWGELIFTHRPPNQEWKQSKYTMRAVNALTQTQTNIKNRNYEKDAEIDKLIQ